MSQYHYNYYPSLTFRGLSEASLEWLKEKEEADKNIINNSQFKLREIRNHFITRRNTQPPAQISIKQFGMGVDPYKLKNRHYKK
jgi:hypothetical protein